MKIPPLEALVSPVLVKVYLKCLQMLNSDKDWLWNQTNIITAITILWRHPKISTLWSHWPTLRVHALEAAFPWKDSQPTVSRLSGHFPTSYPSNGPASLQVVYYKGTVLKEEKVNTSNTSLKHKRFFFLWNWKFEQFISKCIR